MNIYGVFIEFYIIYMLCPVGVTITYRYILFVVIYMLPLTYLLAKNFLTKKKNLLKFNPIKLFCNF